MQALYEQLSAPHMELEYSSPPDLSLSDAIRYSLQTPGALLHRTLQVCTLRVGCAAVY